MEHKREADVEDYWLIQYQRLLESKPNSLLEKVRIFCLLFRTSSVHKLDVRRLTHADVLNGLTFFIVRTLIKMCESVSILRFEKAKGTRAMLRWDKNSIPFFLYWYVVRFYSVGIFRGKRLTVAICCGSVVSWNC